MRKKLAIFLAFILILDAVGLVITLTGKKSGSADVPGVVLNPDNSQQDGDPVFTKASFLAVGDNLIHGSIYKQAKARTGGEGYDFSYCYENVADKVAAADVAILNQETIISPEHAPSDYPMFNSPTEVGDEMLKIGFDVFNLATNHSLDMGEKGLRAAIEFWNSKNAVTTGAYLDQDDFMRLRVVTVNGIHVAYVGFTEMTNGLKLPQDTELVLMLTEREDEIAAWISRAREVADVVIANVHWGVEYTHTPTDFEYSFAQKLANWGVDVIIGNHPHVIQPIEFIDRPDGGRTLCAYSLGNFISAQNKAATMLGGMMTFDIVKNQTTSEISIENVRFSGVVTHYGYSYSNIRIYPLEDYTEELALKHGVRAKNSDFSLEYLNNTVNTVIDKQFLGE